MKIFDRKNEAMGQNELDQCQLERLQALIARLKRNVKSYRDTLGSVQVRSLDDLENIPATTPEDLVAAFPYGMLALPLKEVIHLHSIVGPDGRQVVTGHTRNDLTSWGRLVARQLLACGVSAHDVIQICFGSGFLKEAIGYMIGAELLEASVIPEDTTHIDYELEMLKSYRATVLVTTPTNAMELLRLLDERGIEPQSLHLRTVLLSRPVSNAERDLLRTGLMADIHCTFGVAEIIDPGLCVECAQGRFHVNEDHFLVEERDGELVVTTLCREAMPLLRYRTRTTCTLQKMRCECGRTGITIKPGNRMDKAMRIRETLIYPDQVATALKHTKAAGTPIQTTVSDDHLVVSIELKSGIFSDTLRSLEELRDEARAEIHNRLGIDAEVKLVDQKGE